MRRKGLSVKRKSKPKLLDIKDAPKEGDTVEEIWIHTDAGKFLCHWAYGGGEDQPCFGPAWFYWVGDKDKRNGFYNELSGKILGWEPQKEVVS